MEDSLFESLVKADDSPSYGYYISNPPSPRTIGEGGEEKERNKVWHWTGETDVLLYMIVCSWQSLVYVRKGQVDSRINS